MIAINLIIASFCFLVQPVFLQPTMFLNFFNFWALGRISLKYKLNEFLSITRNMIWEENITSINVLNCFLVARTFERWSTDQKLVCQNPNAPNINRMIILILLDHLGCKIIYCCAAHCFSTIIIAKSALSKIR